MPRTKKAGTRKRSRRQVPWAGWSKVAPQGHARTVMLKNCGTKCFLGPNKSFPICSKGTCKVNNKGIYAAYVRAREWGNKRSKYTGKSRPRHSRKVYTRVARKAKKMLKKRGVFRGKGGTSCGSMKELQPKTF